MLFKKSKNKKYSGPRSLEALMRLIQVEIRKVVLGVIMAEFDVDDEGYLVYNEGGMYNFGISDDGYLEWEVSKND